MSVKLDYLLPTSKNVYQVRPSLTHVQKCVSSWTISYPPDTSKSHMTIRISTASHMRILISTLSHTRIRTNDASHTRIRTSALSHTRIRESVSMLQVTWEFLSGPINHTHSIWTCNKISGMYKLFSTLHTYIPEKKSLVCCCWHCYSCHALVTLQMTINSWYFQV